MRAASDLSFSPSLQHLAARRPIKGRTGKVLEKYPLSTPNNLIVLRNLLIDRKPQRTLEVGLACGGSAIAFATTHRDLGHQPAAQHIAIDPYQTIPQAYDGVGLENLRRAGLDPYVRFMEGYSSNVLPALLGERTRIEFAYIDGSHLFEDVFVDFYYVNQLLSEGGVMCFDDCAVPDIRKVLGFISRNMKGHLEELDLSPFRSDGGRSIKYRLAGLLGKRQLRAFVKVGEAGRRFKAPFRDF